MYVCMCVCGQVLHADRLSLDKSSEPSAWHNLHHRGDAGAFPCSSRGAIQCLTAPCKRRENGKSRDHPSGGGWQAIF